MGAGQLIGADESFGGVAGLKPDSYRGVDVQCGHDRGGEAPSTFQR